MEIELTAGDAVTSDFMEKQSSYLCFDTELTGARTNKRRAINKKKREIKLFYWEDIKVIWIYF